MSLSSVLGINARNVFPRNGPQRCSSSIKTAIGFPITCQRHGKAVTNNHYLCIHRTFHATARYLSSVPRNVSLQLPLSEQLRHVMRRLTHPVVICTSSDPAATSPRPSSSSTPSSPRGMTMSSFASVSLASSTASAASAPLLPIITFNVALPSRTLDAIVRSRLFNVHVVAANAAGARLAERFTHGNSAGSGSVGPWEGLEGEDVGVRYPSAEEAEIGGEEAKVEPPMLVGDAVIAVLRCRLLRDAGEEGLVMVRNDHAVVLGEVLEILGRGAVRGDADGEGKVLGLAYADRRYRAPGGIIEKHVP